MGACTHRVTLSLPPSLTHRQTEIGILCLQGALAPDHLWRVPTHSGWYLHGDPPSTHTHTHLHTRKKKRKEIPTKGRSDRLISQNSLNMQIYVNICTSRNPPWARVSESVCVKVHTMCVCEFHCNYRGVCCAWVCVVTVYTEIFLHLFTTCCECLFSLL